MAEPVPKAARRRHGEELQAALLEAAWEELVETGYAKLTMESVARRAHTGIAVLYRRWANKDQLVLAACDLVGSRYGALLVFGADGRLSRFVTHGVDRRQESRIGSPPTGCGLLGLNGHPSGTLRMDDLTLALTLLFVAAGIATVLLAWRGLAPREAGHGEFYCLLLATVAGMVMLVAAQNLVAVFIGYELLSIPLYALHGFKPTGSSTLIG